MRRFLERVPSLLICAAVLAVCGCGGSAGGSMQNSPPISVSLGQSKIVLTQEGMPAYVQIFIDSPSETALVSFTGMPGGVRVTYQASDTSPSGLLTFTPSEDAQLGTYTPKVTVQSAGQTASATFTLVVNAQAGSS